MHTSHANNPRAIPIPGNTTLLKEFLQRSGIDCSNWGRNGMKSLGDLHEELTNGEARLCQVGRNLVREVRVVNIDVLAEDKQGRLCRLREVRQVFPDGSERKRNTGTSVAEKVYGEETLESAARRGLLEEIRLKDELELRSLAPIERVRPSDSYPTLQCRYMIYPGFVRLNAKQRDAISLKEEKHGKVTYFDWERI